MADGVVRIPVDTLERFMLDTFVALGVPPEDAEVAAEILITSDLWGVESHGIGRLKMYVDRIRSGLQLPVTRMEVVRDTPTTAVVDGAHGMGQVIAHRCMEMAIQKARRYGMGSVAVRNSTHFGVDGYYAMMAANAGMVGFSVTNARPSVAPTFGVQPMLGTNPIAVAAPTDEAFPFLYDAATSITQRGKIEVLERKGLPAHEGWVIGSDGALVTDSAQILRDLSSGRAALLPLGGDGDAMGGHKGYGLSVFVEILSAALQTGNFLSGLAGVDRDGKPRPYGLGHFFMAIDVEHFCPLDEFKRVTGDILRELRASQKAAGCDRIYTAGEKEFESERRVRAEGVAVNASLARDIRSIQQDLGLSHYNLQLP
jgi:L-2-hydroxycarboxylate dehydrogenase (NAD+)